MSSSQARLETMIQDSAIWLCNCLHCSMCVKSVKKICSCEVSKLNQISLLDSQNWAVVSSVVGQFNDLKRFFWMQDSWAASRVLFTHNLTGQGLGPCKALSSPAKSLNWALTSWKVLLRSKNFYEGGLWRSFHWMAGDEGCEWECCNRTSGLLRVSWTPSSSGTTWARLHSSPLLIPTLSILGFGVPVIVDWTQCV